MSLARTHDELRLATVGDYFALLKPRVMSLVLVGCAVVAVALVFAADRRRPLQER